MKDKIIKDIRYSESEILNIEGNSHPSNFGKIYIGVLDVVAIGQRIARKLNELKFVSGEFDHIYINFTTVLHQDDFKVSKRDVEKWLKYVDYGLSTSFFNAKTDSRKRDFIKEATFKALKAIYSSDEENLAIIEKVENLIHRFDTELSIHYKTKETNSYRIDISYQIKPNGGSSKAIVVFNDKRKNFKGTVFFDLRFYEDIYSLIDTITLKDKHIILSPKKSFRAGVYNDQYKTPLMFPTDQLREVCN
jgi:hypothetical protein